MKKIPFDLERALAGESVVTGEGVDVSEIYYLSTADQLKVEYPVITVIDGDIHFFTIDGCFYSDRTDSVRNLFMKPKTVTKYVVIPKNMLLFDSEKEAINFSHGLDIITILPVVMEE